MNISATNGHSIKHKESEKLSNELAEFEAKGGKIKQFNNVKHVEIQFNNRAKSQKKSEKDKAFRQRKLIQLPVIQEYSNWGGHCKWQKLSEAAGGKVSSGTLSNVNQGLATIESLEDWKNIVEAIELLRGSK